MKDKDKSKKPIKPLSVGDKTIPPEGAKMIPVFIMGKEYMIPETLTVIKAMEYAGYKYMRGCGCRGGICGACGMYYRIAGDYKLRSGLACQTVIQPNMILAQLPFFPANRPNYLLDKFEADIQAAFRNLYPEIFKCVGCGICSRVCPMDIDVMDYIALMKRGDLKGAAETSFDCVMCGLCANRCPAQLSQFTAAMLVRRITGRYLAPKAEHLKKRVAEVEEGKYIELLKRLADLPIEALKKLYVEREREPDMSEPGKWMPEDRKHL
ncbi:MAG: 4Fe-4S dicluster domain-containing protein [Thermodesulfobacteriota bacterium]